MASNLICMGIQCLKVDSQVDFAILVANVPRILMEMCRRVCNADVKVVEPEKSKNPKKVLSWNFLRLNLNSK